MLSIVNEVNPLIFRSICFVYDTNMYFSNIIYHSFDNKRRRKRRRRGNLQIKKNKKLKSRAAQSHKLTRFHEQLKRIEREQYIEIKEKQKHVLITSK